jgi:hypothetical protein
VSEENYPLTYRCWCNKVFDTFEERKSHSDQEGCDPNPKKNASENIYAARAILRNPGKFPSWKVEWAERTVRPA